MGDTANNSLTAVPDADGIFLVAADPPAPETVEKMQKLIEQALAIMWRHGLSRAGMSPWRVFYACLASQLPISATYIPAVAIRGQDGNLSVKGRLAHTNGAQVVLNAAMGCNLKPEEIATIIFHELEHIVRRHHSRIAGRDPAIWNWACDYVINAELAAEGFDLPAGTLTHPKVSAKDLEEDVYDRLVHNGQPDSGQTDSLVLDLLGDVGPESAHADATRAIRAAAAAAQALAGELPGSVTHYLEAERIQRPSWIRVVKRWMDDEIRAKRSWTRPSRRSAWMQIPAPGNRRSHGTLGIVLDTSGSMSDGMLAKALGTIAALASEIRCAVKLWQCDAEVYGPFLYESPQTMPTQWPISGRGGTVMEPAAQAIAKEPPRLTLWITDGFWADSPVLPQGKHICVLIGGERPPEGVSFDGAIKVE